MKTAVGCWSATKPAALWQRDTVLLVAIAGLLGGCAAVGPNYSAPVPTAPATWQSAAAARVGLVRATPEELAHWWRQLDDPVLTELVEQALQTSLDLRTAQAKLREARARRALVVTNRFPTVTASGTANVSKGSAETGAGKTRELYSAGFDASWEPDVLSAGSGAARKPPKPIWRLRRRISMLYRYR